VYFQRTLLGFSDTISINATSVIAVLRGSIKATSYFPSQN
jgi:hypothetical protein